MDQIGLKRVDGRAHEPLHGGGSAPVHGVRLASERASDDQTGLGPYVPVTGKGQDLDILEVAAQRGDRGIDFGRGAEERPLVESQEENAMMRRELHE
jgi:hypothetical protein